MSKDTQITHVQIEQKVFDGLVDMVTKEISGSLYGLSAMICIELEKQGVDKDAQESLKINIFREALKGDSLAEFTSHNGV